MKLYSYWRSSSAWRVRIALAHKALPHELVPVNLLRGEQQQPVFRALNAMTQVPVLEVDEDGRLFRLTQSSAIMEYLEERFPERPLLPADRAGRARAREMMQIVNSGMQPFQNLSLQRALERIASESAGRFLVRDGVTLADIFLVPQLFSARRFGIDLEPFPTLRRVDAECSMLAEFQSAHPNAQPDYDPAA